MERLSCTAAETEGYTYTVCSVYGSDYAPALPVVLIEMPTNDAALLAKQLPASLFQFLTATSSTATATPGTETLEFYILIHTATAPSVCQHFTCDNTNEANMMYHAWCFPNVQFTPDLVVFAKIQVGLFEANGIKPAHLNLLDGGVPFETLDKRTVVIHHSAFSPENVQFQMADEVEICSFFSLAINETNEGVKKVIGYHVLPRNEVISDQIAQGVSRANTVDDLLQQLASIPTTTDVAEKLRSIFSALN